MRFKIILKYNTLMQSHYGDCKSKLSSLLIKAKYAFAKAYTLQLTSREL
ncbi:hypothetical protein [uncultured Dokdonia sp.]|nr:hypothetical protein [uncultured Dokdonia sp.]